MALNHSIIWYLQKPPLTSKYTPVYSHYIQLIYRYYVHLLSSLAIQQNQLSASTTSRMSPDTLQQVLLITLQTTQGDFCLGAVVLLYVLTATNTTFDWLRRSTITNIHARMVKNSSINCTKLHLQIFFKSRKALFQCSSTLEKLLQL